MKIGVISLSIILACSAQAAFAQPVHTQFLVGFKHPIAKNQLQAASRSGYTVKWLNSTHAMFTMKQPQALVAQGKMNVVALKQAWQIRHTHPNMRYVIPVNTRFYPLSIHAKYWPHQWDMHGENSIHVEDAWQNMASDVLHPVTVAVIDSGLGDKAPMDIVKRVKYGIHFEVSPYQQNIIWSYHFLDTAPRNSHGTHVAGTIMADGSYVMGVAGNLDAHLFHFEPVKVLGTNGGGIGAILAGVDWAIGTQPGQGFLPEDAPRNTHPAQVLNLSLGMSRINPQTGQPIMSMQQWQQEVVSQFCPAWQEVVARAHAKNMTLVFAAGNDGHDVSNDVPSGCTQLHSIIVEATTRSGYLTRYSTTSTKQSAGTNTVIYAPGGERNSDGNGAADEILSTLNGYPCTAPHGNQPSKCFQQPYGYGYMQGTSMAAPHVAGIAALLYAIKPDATWRKVTNVLGTAFSNKGIIDAKKAVVAMHS